MEPLFARPSLHYEKMTVQDMSLFDATLVFTFNVRNPNPLGISIQRGTYNFAIEGSSVASGALDKRFMVPASGTGTIDLPVRVNFMDFFNSVAALAGRDEVAYTLSGSFDMLGYTIPYKTDGKLDLPDFPEISVESLNISEFSLSRAKLNIVVAVSNPNAFAIEPGHLNFSLDVGGMTFLSGVTQTMQGIDKNGRLLIPVPLEIDFVSMGRSAIHLLGGNAAPYRLTGEMRLKAPGAGTEALPFSRSGEVALRR
jgi:LEA14-like dessication related protein